MDGASQDVTESGLEPDTLRIVAVGGFQQVGMNCVAFEQGSERVLVDCGLTFADEEWGVEAYRPSLESMIGPGVLRGIVVTHGHEDHIGAVPDLLSACNVPVWGSDYAVELVRRKLVERFGDTSTYALHTFGSSHSFRVGPFSFEAVRVAHSTPGAYALAVRTASGLVVHSGDFNLDESLPDGQRSDEDKLRQLGDEGVRLLLSDSTNSISEGRCVSQRNVIDALDAAIGQADGRVLVSLFASNVYRLREIGHLARRHGRKLCLLGRGMMKHGEVAAELGLLDWPSDLRISVEQAAERPSATVLYAATGTQGETRGALSRVAAGVYPRVALEPGDTVILSSRVIPGRELAVQRTVDRLIHRGVQVHSLRSDRQLHASGHAHRAELARLLELIRPECFVPVHGGPEQLQGHAKHARSCGVSETWVLNDGDQLWVRPARVQARRAPAPLTPVAVVEGRPVPEPVLRERQQLGRHGVVCITVWVDDSGEVQAAVAAMGVTTDPELPERVAATVEREARVSVASTARGARVLEQTVRAVARRELRAMGEGRPMLLVRVIPTGSPTAR